MRAYFRLPQELRETLYGALRAEDEGFILGLLKCINIIFDPENNKSHDGTISIYRDLFITKWDEKAEKYKSLITK